MQASGWARFSMWFTLGSALLICLPLLAAYFFAMAKAIKNMDRLGLAASAGLAASLKRVKTISAGLFRGSAKMAGLAARASQASETIKKAGDKVIEASLKFREKLSHGAE